jgi:hypothetical protein
MLYMLTLFKSSDWTINYFYNWSICIKSVPTIGKPSYNAEYTTGWQNDGVGTKSAKDINWLG